MDENGKEFIVLNIDELEKNHGVFSNGYDGVMYATNKATCPVASFKLFLKKLNPKVDFLFQHPKSTHPHDGPWYNAQDIGVKFLSLSMKTISQDANLSITIYRYTNHCIRVTCKVSLKDFCLLI